MEKWADLDPEQFGGGDYPEDCYPVMLPPAQVTVSDTEPAPPPTLPTGACPLCGHRDNWHAADCNNALA